MNDIQRISELRKKKKQSADTDIQRIADLRQRKSGKASISNLDSDIKSLDSAYKGLSKYGSGGGYKTYDTASDEFYGARKDKSAFNTQAYKTKRNIEKYLEQNDVDDKTKNELTSLAKQIQSQIDSADDFVTSKYDESQFYGQFKR